MIECFVVVDTGMNASSACLCCEAGTYQTGSGASALKCIELQRGATWPDDLALTFTSCCVDCSYTPCCGTSALPWDSQRKKAMLHLPHYSK